MEKNDQVLIKALPGNDTCCECQTARNPTWCSVSFGVLMCLECSGKHRGLGTHISFVRSLDMDHFTTQQVQLLKEGGNQVCNRYLRGTDVRSKYDSPTASLYKKWLLAKVEGGGDASQVKEYEQLLLKSSSSIEAGDDSSKTSNNHARPRMNFANTTPPPSFLQAFASTCRLIVGITSDSLGPWLVKGIVGVFFATAAYQISTSYPGDVSSTSAFGAVGRWIQWLTLGVTGSFVALVFILVPLQNTFAFSRHRISAFKSAVNDFTERVYQGRAKRNPGYDIFFPPGVSIGDSVDTAFIFFPGLLVDFMAYATVLGKLSDAGFLVILLNTEPTRMIDRQNGYTAGHAQSIMTEIQTLLGIQVKHWALGGHSLGGYTAAWLAMELRGSTTSAGAGAGAGVVNKCVLLAVGNRFHLSQIHKQEAIQVLTIDCSNDGILLGVSPSGTLDLLRQAAQEHPTRHVVIEGGNHSGFGHYGPQVYPKRDGDRIGITLDQQQEQTLKAITTFLSSSNTNSKEKEQTTPTSRKKQD
jgi:predicted esterase YcpF (UPF0227 family)